MKSRVSSTELCAHDKECQVFWRNVDKHQDDQCWKWTGTANNRGYGEIYAKGKRMFAHRFSWEIHYGLIPEHDSYHGWCVLHRCDNPACVNPTHLFLGTQADNMRDKKKKGRTVTGEAARTLSVLSVDDVVQIKQMLNRKISLRNIASKFGVSHNTIWLIKQGKLWVSVE